MKAGPETSGHLLLLGSPVWGHIRPLCAFAGKAARERPDITITLMFAGGYDDRIQGEISRYVPENDSDTNFQARIRVIKIGGDNSLNFLHLLEVMYSTFPEYYEKLVLGEPIQSQSGGASFPGIRCPTLVVLDFFLLRVLENIRARTGNTIPILAWDVLNIFMTLRLYGPEEMGGVGDVLLNARILSEKTGQNEAELIYKMSYPMTGALVNVPGLPPFYDYELFPQPRSNTTNSTPVFLPGYELSRKCDGYLCISSSAYEMGAIKAFRKWLSGTGNRELYLVGPLLPPGFGQAKHGSSSTAKSYELAMSENGGELLEFMDNILKTCGKQSLVYISFGSLWWPDNESVLLFIEVFLELEVPFILSDVKSNVPPELAQKVKASGIGIISKWSPQQTIFNHPVTGWVLTHCGQNTVIEALAEGLPMIAWPLLADQPANAMHLTLNLDVAFELIEVRTSEVGRKPMYRGAQAKGTPEAVIAEAKKVLQMMRGAEGAQKRRNAEAMRDKLRMAWEEGGEALEDMRRVLRLVSEVVL